jgi:hypothetical protein
LITRTSSVYFKLFFKINSTFHYLKGLLVRPLASTRTAPVQRLVNIPGIQQSVPQCLPALTFGPKGQGIFFFFIKIFKHLDHSYNITILKKERIAIIGREIKVKEKFHYKL